MNRHLIPVMLKFSGKSCCNSSKSDLNITTITQCNKLIKEEAQMKGKEERFCVECGEMSEFVYDGEQWMCLNCGVMNRRVIQAIPPLYDDDEFDGI
jgi:ribosomal protein S27AE